MKKLAITMIVLGAVALYASASVTYDVQAAYVYSDNGSSLIGTNRLVAFIADVDGDGFGDWNSTSLGGTGFTIDADDYLLGIGSSGEAGEGLIWNTFIWADVTNVQGKNWAMVWFDTEYVANSAGAGDGVRYGVYEGGEIVPPDGDYPASTYGTSLPWYTQEVGGPVSNSAFYSPYMTGGVPEPMTVTLLLVGGGLLAARRNAKRRCA